MRGRAADLAESVGATHASPAPVTDALPARKSIRLQGFDYTSAGAYFVTICTQGRAFIFGDVVEGEVVPTEAGRIAESVWRQMPEHLPGVAVDEFVVMPNHVHGLIWISEKPAVAQGRATHASPLRNHAKGPASGSLGAAVGSFKAAVSKELRRSRPGLGVWQRGFFEHVVRNEEDLLRIRTYIRENPIRWEIDGENPQRREPRPDEEPGETPWT